MGIKKNENRRISFGEFDAAHLYSLALEHFCVSKNEGVCVVCVNLKNRIEKFIGPTETRRIQRQAKEKRNRLQLHKELRKGAVAQAARDRKIVVEL